MLTTYEVRRQTASCIFDVQDRFARVRGVRGSHPRPIGPVAFTLTSRMIAGVASALDEPLELVIRRNSSGYDLCFGRAKPAIDAAGRRTDSSRERVLAEGAYVVRLTSSYYQPLEKDIVLPTPETPYLIELEPSYAYPYPGGPTAATLIRGSVHERDGRGVAHAEIVARAEIEVAGFSRTYTTDETGKWALPLSDVPASGLVNVRFTLPDGSVRNLADVPAVAGNTTSLSQTSLYGRVQTASGNDVAGARILIKDFSEEVTTRRDGSWSYYFDLEQGDRTVGVRVVLPGGGGKTAPNIEVKARAMTKVPIIRVS